MTNHAEKRAQGLIDGGWYQISRHHRTVARLPEGKTGSNALIGACMKRHTINLDYWIPEIRRWVEGMGEVNAADYFMRVYARDDLVQELDRVTFAEFRRLGGSTRRAAEYAPLCGFGEVC